MAIRILVRIGKVRILGKSPVGAFLRLNGWVWSHLPSYSVTLSPVRPYATFLHTLVRLHASRRQFFGTFFFRNRPELELIRRLSDQQPIGSILKLSVLACSNGAEVYSILWTILSARPDLKVVMHAVDISKEAVEYAQKGVYSLKTPTEFVEEPFFSRMTEAEMQALFDTQGEQARIKSWLKEGIIWLIEDAGDPELVNVLGPQDMVVANNFLCHMQPPDAQRCLRNIARFVNPGGYIFVSGIDLDIRTRIARDLGWTPLQDLIEEIHEGDPILRNGWPWKYWGLEPMSKRRDDWNIRYASAFRLGKTL